MQQLRQLKKVPEIAKAQSVTCEINPYFLYCNADNISDKDTKFKTTPPVRDSIEQELTL